MHQHCYTSLPRGLFPGRSGYTTVAQTPGMGRSLTDTAERLSTFAPLDPNPTAYASEPVNWFHMVVTQAGTRSHFVSRVGACPPDYTGRSNYLAHHLILTPQEAVACPAGPADLLAEPGWIMAEWTGEARELPSRQVPTLASEKRTSAVQAAGLEAGWAQELADRLQDRSLKQIWLVYPRGVDALGIVRDVLSHLDTKEDRWSATFTTHAAKNFPGMGFDAKLRCVVAGTPYAQEVLSRYPDAIDVAKRPACPERKQRATAPSPATPAAPSTPKGPSSRPASGPLGGAGRVASATPPSPSSWDSGSDWQALPQDAPEPAAAGSGLGARQIASAPPVPPQREQMEWWQSPGFKKVVVGTTLALVILAIAGVVALNIAGQKERQISQNAPDGAGGSQGKGTQQAGGQQAGGHQAGGQQAGGQQAGGQQAGGQQAGGQQAGGQQAGGQSKPPQPEPRKPEPPKPEPPKPEQGGPQLIKGATAKLRTAKREEKIVEDLADLPKDGLEIKPTPEAGLVEHSLQAKGKEWVLKVAGKEACRFAHEMDKLTATFADYEKVPQRALAHGLMLVVKPSGSAKQLEVPLGEPLDLALSIRSVEKGVDRLKPGGTYELVSGSKKDIDAFMNALGWADDLVDVIEFEGTGDLKLVTKDGPDGGFVVVDKSTGRGVVLKREPAEKGEPVKYKCTHYVLEGFEIPSTPGLAEVAAPSGSNQRAQKDYAMLQKLKGKKGFFTNGEYQDLRTALRSAAEAVVKGLNPGKTIDPGMEPILKNEQKVMQDCLPSVEDCELRIDQFGKRFRVTLRKSRGDSAGIVVVDSLK
jgi:hypothetical protein